MSEKSKNIISYFLTVIMIILIIIEGILMIFKDRFEIINVKKCMEDINYYGQVEIVINETINDYILQSGFDESILSDVISDEKIKEDVNSIVYAIYYKSDITIKTDDIRQKLDSNIQEYIKNNNLTLTDENKKDIEEFEDNVTKKYEENVVPTPNILKTLQNIYNQYLQKLGKVIGENIIVIIIIGIIIYILRKDLLGNICFSVGVTYLFFSLYSKFNIAIQNISIVNKAFSELFTNLCKQMMNDILKWAIVFLVLGILLIIYSSHKIAKDKTKQAMREDRRKERKRQKEQEENEKQINDNKEKNEDIEKNKSKIDNKEKNKKSDKSEGKNTKKEDKKK